MTLGKNRIKYLSSLKIKKYRDTEKQFVIEGDKIVRDALKRGTIHINQLVATESWLKTNQSLTQPVTEVIEADIMDLGKISSFETPPPVIALLDIPRVPMDLEMISQTLCIGLDNIQDPGNLGTIIRTADWFGINQVICSEGCADRYNPKVIQASMGAIMNVNVYYADLVRMLVELSQDPGYHIAGTFMHGTAVNKAKSITKGMILFGNESRGISDELLPCINQRLTVPPGRDDNMHVESLNVASSVAVVLAMLKLCTASHQQPDQ